jgi:threonine aldolase
MKAMADVNIGDTIAYGDDPYTAKAVEKFKKILGENINVFFVYNGTAANVLSMSSFLNSYNAIICSDVSHINNDECGANENFSGYKLISILSENGKISIESIKKYLHSFGFEHHSM